MTLAHDINQTNKDLNHGTWNTKRHLNVSATLLFLTFVNLGLFFIPKNIFNSYNGMDLVFPSRFHTLNTWFSVYRNNRLIRGRT